MCTYISTVQGLIVPVHILPLQWISILAGGKTQCSNLSRGVYRSTGAFVMTTYIRYIKNRHTPNFLREIPLRYILVFKNSEYGRICRLEVRFFFLALDVWREKLNLWEKRIVAFRVKLSCRLNGYVAVCLKMCNERRCVREQIQRWNQRFIQQQ